jgi:D-glycero-D-manno-heptose 1,7-bisphosphate phosphatase
MLKRAVFLDRDGVINVNYGHVHTPEQFEWVEGAPEAIRHLNASGFLVIVITNQAGIAKGFYTEQQFLEFMRWVIGQLAQKNARLDAFYYCPHHPTEGFAPYVMQCECRKPGSKLILQAIQEHQIDPVKSFLIGDKESDIIAANRANVVGLLFSGGNLLEFVREHIR